MFSYLAFLHSGIESASENAFEDGAQLANDCITQLNELEDRDQFPPSLLILLASPAYLDLPRAEQLLQGINQPFTEAGFDDVPLIGSSVAAVFFDRRVHEKGALLVCIASRLIEAQVAIGANARKAPEDAIKSLLHDLKLASEEDEEDRDPNPRADRTLLTFFPGFGEAGAIPAYPAPNLHRNLRKGTRARIRIVGGVSSANDPHRATPGLQFANKQLIKDAVVAALITCGAPMGISLGRGLSPTRRILQVKRLSEDGKAILEFDQGSAVDIIQQEGSPVFLGEMSTSVTSDEPMITAPRIAPDGRSVQVLREINQNAYFEVLKPEPEKLINAAIESISMARGGILIRNPVTTSLMLPCNIWNPHFNSLGLNFEHGLTRIEEDTGIPCVGGFVDGEAGVDETARSLFSNGGVVGIVFGDELRERTPMYRGFDAFAKHGDRLAGASAIAEIADRTGKVAEYNIGKGIEEAIDAALQIVVDTGFPGAMLHLLMPYKEQVVGDDQRKKFILTRQCKGARFEKMKETMMATPIPLSDDNILAIVAREEKPRFIIDSRENPLCDSKFVKGSGIISQYVMPLSRLKKNVLGVLQIDLGNVEFLRPSVKQVLKSLEDILAVSLNRLFNLVELYLARDLDKALNDSLSAETIEQAAQILIDKAVAALNLDTGHLRLADVENQRLLLVAGVGRYYDAAKETRKAIDLNTLSITCDAFRQAYLNKGTYIVVVNDAENNDIYRKRCLHHKEELPILHAALEQMKSFVTMVFGDEKGEKFGALLFAADKAWFFTPSHVRAINALGQRLGFLVEHFKRKRGEEEARKRLQFLFEVSPQFAQIENLDDPSSLLTEATKQFSRAAGAEKAALYLLDESQSQYILRAQYGWSDPRWVNAARHGLGDYWTGTAAVAGKPFHVEDLHNYFEAKRNLGIKPRYNVQIFGQELSPNSTVESIGLPLLIAGKPLGVLVLYRRIVPGLPSVFATISMELLLEAADRLAGLVSVLLSHRKDRWDNDELTRRQEVHEATITRHPLPEGEQEEDFETRICRQVLKSYRAVEAVFYKYESDKRIITPICGLRRTQGTGAITNLSPSNDISAFVWQTAIDNQTSENKIKTDSPCLSEDDWKYPERVATLNLVNRACIPLAGEEQLVGLLDLRWHVNHRQAFSLSYRHDEKMLLALGNVIGSAYLRHRLTEEREYADREARQRRMAVEAMGAMVAQSAHHFMNHLVSVGRLAVNIKEASNEAEREHWTDELVKAASEGSKMITRPMRAAERAARRISERYHLYSLIVETIDEVVDELRRITLQPPDYSDIYVMVNPDNVRESFVNILRNAAKSINDNNGGSLIISISAPDNDRVQVVFEDTGIGMTEEEIEDAMNGFVNTQSGGGIGVLLSRVLLEAQDGKLELKSEKGAWTKAFVTLPLAN
jgi:signal transduction histidine kinase